MSTKNSSRGAHSKISSAASPAVPSATQSAQRSSVSKSAFAPSHFQLALFASVIQGFDSQYLRIHDVNSGRLRCEHAAGAGTTVTSLDWGYYGSAVRDRRADAGKTKRKRGSANKQVLHAPESAVLAFGTSASDIRLFSPSTANVVGKLAGHHERGVKDFKFCSVDYLQGWSIGGDGKLVQWDLGKDQATRTISLPDSSIHVLAPPSTSEPQILCASVTPYAISFTGSDDFRIDSFDAFKNPIHALIRSVSDTKSSGFKDTFLASDRDRYLNIYDVAQHRLIKTLIAGGEVTSVDFNGASVSLSPSEQMVLAVTTQTDVVDLFTQPFAQALSQSEVNGAIKSKRKNMTRKANASVKIIRPNSNSTIVPIFNATLQGPNLVVATADGGVDVSFQKVRWQDEGTGELLFDGVKEVVKTQSSSSMALATMNGVKDVGKTYVDESRTVVVDSGVQGSSQTEAIEISSADESEAGDTGNEASESEVEGEDGGGSKKYQNAVVTSAAELDAAVNTSDTEMVDATDAIATDQKLDETVATEKPEEPSFGEILAAQNPGTISIAAALPPGDTAMVTTDTRHSLALTSSGFSLSTVLTQSLRTNDQSLLETCLHTVDTSTIRLTIQRLDSSLAGTLLQKLAERLSSKPGRYGHLLVWVQWICVAHGGAIAGRPDVLAKVRTLFKVLNQRSKTLDNLLLLKGKLDMLDAQISLRRQLQAERRTARDRNDKRDVIYIEGQEDDSTSDDDEAAGDAPAAVKAGRTKKALPDLVDEESSDEDGGMPTTNGVASSSDAEGSDDEQVDEDVPAQTEGGLIDDEAEESDEGSQGEMQEESDDEDDEETDEGTDEEMDDFINDDSTPDVVSAAASEVEADDTPDKPPTKKTKR